MYCTNCGAKLNDGAKFCHECCARCDTQPEQEVKLTVTRIASGGGMALPVDVNIDGYSIGQLKYGKSGTVSVAPGEHTIYMKMKSGGDRSDIITIPESATEAHYSFRISGVQCIPERANFYTDAQPDSAPVEKVAPSRSQRKSCPRCGGEMAMQTVTESRKSGCGTVLLYILLCLTILGILIVIPLLLRKKTETVTYAVCQNCGYRMMINRH